MRLWQSESFLYSTNTRHDRRLAVAILAPCLYTDPALPTSSLMILRELLEETLRRALVEALLVVHVPRAAIPGTLRADSKSGWQ